MKFHSMDQSRAWLRRFIRSNPKVTLKRCFKLMRNRNDLAFYGDWPILREVIFVRVSYGITDSAKAVMKVCRLSDDPELMKIRTNSILMRILTESEES